MKLLFISFCLFISSWGLPEGRRKRPEEHWRPSKARDITKYQPRGLAIQKKHTSLEKTYMENLIHEARLSFNKNSKVKKGTIDLRETCGIEGPPTKIPFIVGGEEAVEGQFPWVASLFIDDAWFCGGSIISDTYILTAAHCVDGATYVDVMLGAFNIRDPDEPNRVEIASYEMSVHPGWNSNDLSNDLALIVLPSPVDFTDYISPICLPARDDTADVGELMTILGWGKPSDSAGGISPTLRYVEVPIISNSECNAVYGIVGPGVVCVDTTGGQGSCNGDSGGPTMMKADGQKGPNPGQQWNQAGIVSFGSSAGCEIGMPAGFTRVEYYLDWIESETGLMTF